MKYDREFLYPLLKGALAKCFLPMLVNGDAYVIEYTYDETKHHYKRILRKGVKIDHFPFYGGVCFLGKNATFSTKSAAFRKLSRMIDEQISKLKSLKKIYESPAKKR